MDIINVSSKITNKIIKYNIESRRQGDTASLISSPKLASSLIAWEPKFSDLETIIKSTWNLYK